MREGNGYEGHQGGAEKPVRTLWPCLWRQEKNMVLSCRAGIKGEGFKKGVGVCTQKSEGMIIAATTVFIF